MIAIVECPSISLTIFGWTPRPRAIVAAVWRRSWKRIWGSTSALERLLEVPAQLVEDLTLAHAGRDGERCRSGSNRSPRHRRQDGERLLLGERPHLAAHRARQ
ncbi:MAG: hypothetical protein ACRDM0_00355 [Thermoleophilaceae bacterium]